VKLRVVTTVRVSSQQRAARGRGKRRVPVRRVVVRKRAAGVYASIGDGLERRKVVRLLGEIEADRGVAARMAASPEASERMGKIPLLRKRA
jgi:hypothetical protein